MCATTDLNHILSLQLYQRRKEYLYYVYYDSGKEDKWYEEIYSNDDEYYQPFLTPPSSLPVIRIPLLGKSSYSSSFSTSLSDSCNNTFLFPPSNNFEKNDVNTVEVSVDFGFFLSSFFLFIFIIVFF
jgi:hypothetical protein